MRNNPGLHGKAYSKNYYRILGRKDTKSGLQGFSLGIILIIVVWVLISIIL